MGTLKEMLSQDRFAACAGVELLEISPGYAKARMEVTDNHLNAGGVCQGGALFTLADLAFAAVANSREKLTLSLNAQITFLRPARKGYVYAEANEVFNHGAFHRSAHHGRESAVGRCPHQFGLSEKRRTGCGWTGIAGWLD